MRNYFRIPECARGEQSAQQGRRVRSPCMRYERYPRWDGCLCFFCITTNRIAMVYICFFLCALAVTRSRPRYLIATSHIMLASPIHPYHKIPCLSLP